MRTQPFPSSRLRLPAFLFIASPVAFIAVIVTAILGFSKVGVFEKIAPAQMASIRVTWSLFNAFGANAVLFGAGGVVTRSIILKETKPRLLALIALVRALLALAISKAAEAAASRDGANYLLIDVEIILARTPRAGLEHSPRQSQRQTYAPPSLARGGRRSSPAGTLAGIYGSDVS